MELERDEQTVEIVPYGGVYTGRPRFRGLDLGHREPLPPFDIWMDLQVDQAGHGHASRIVIRPIPGLGDDPARPTPLDRATLAKINLAMVMDNIMILEAQMHTAGRGVTESEFLEGAKTGRAQELVEVLADDADARTAIRKNRRRRVTPELLATVVELYEQGGIEAVTKGTSYSEPYSWKLLRRAKKELPQP
jgi:hypothetical protein